MHDDGNPWMDGWMAGGIALWVILGSLLVTLLYFVVTTIFGSRIHRRPSVPPK